ncbi:MAG TPA: cupin domain-containing protein [Bryobacteraceae bacterium]|nr:cupin domain-containing protein [Bryobacteraceae bacterium]
MQIDRRSLVSLLPAVIAQGAVLAAVSEASGQTAPQSAVLPSAVYEYASLPVHASKASVSRPVLKGKLATGESIEVHETTLPPGGAPHPPHHHVHSEMWLIREGTVQITIVGKSYTLGPGSVAFVKSDDEHGITNPSDKSASYFVVAIGPGADA